MIEPETRREPGPRCLVYLDRAAGALIVLIGLVHLGVGRGSFFAPTERGVWFLSAGFLLVTTGLANIASVTASSRLQTVTAASGSLAILILGALIARSDPDLLFAPQTLVLLALGAFLSGLRMRDLFRL